MALKIQNPFIVAGKIPPDYFCDRREESKRIVRELTNGNNVVLISPRRMGKTGLIQYCFDIPGIRDSYATFYIDILQTSSLAEFTYLLGKEIFQKLVPLGVRRLKKFVAFLRSLAGSFGFDPLTGAPAFNIQIGDISNPELTIDEIFRYIAESDMESIIAIDEFQQISKYKEKNVEAMLRSHIQQLPGSHFVFAGSDRHLLQQMFTQSARPFYNSASIIHLLPIPLDEYTSFAIRLFNEYGKNLDPEAVAYAYDMIEGNTFCLQKIFNIAFSKTIAGETCSKEAVLESVKELIASYDTIFREILSQMGMPQKQLLIAIASEGSADSITSAAFVRTHALSSASSVQASARKLLDTNFIVRTDNSYRIQDPLLRLWLLLIYTPAPLFPCTRF